MALLFAAAAVGVLALFLFPPPTVALHLAAPTAGTPARTALLSPAAQVAPTTVIPVSNIAGLTLGIGANPSRICAYGESTCPAGTGSSHVTMTAVAGLQG
ncbi:MAG: hypothetical protein L3K07_06910, partial [Thermoplasmata archaeon]|nr:hypothetical protein [Thermoplasmata archaeon]